jgi:hypothetical protein
MTIGACKLPGCDSFPPVGSDQGPVGLAEFTAALSLAADQAAGLSLEHGPRIGHEQRQNGGSARVAQVRAAHA